MTDPKSAAPELKRVLSRRGLHFDLIVQLLNFGAFVGFILSNLRVVRHFYLRLHRGSGIAVLTNLIFPPAGAGICGYIWLNLSSKTQIAGFAWLCLGIGHLAVLTRGFRIPPVGLRRVAMEKRHWGIEGNVYGNALSNIFASHTKRRRVFSFLLRIPSTLPDFYLASFILWS